MGAEWTGSEAMRVPPDASIGSVGSSPDAVPAERRDWYGFVSDAVLVRRFEKRPLRRCCCCGEQYERGKFRCCAPPNGMRSDVWLAGSCPMPDHGGCGKCAKHCQCPNKAARLQAGPLGHLCDEFMTRLGR